MEGVRFLGIISSTFLKTSSGTRDKLEYRLDFIELCIPVTEILLKTVAKIWSVDCLVSGTLRSPASSIRFQRYIYRLEELLSMNIEGSRIFFRSRVSWISFKIYIRCSTLSRLGSTIRVDMVLTA